MQTANAMTVCNACDVDQMHADCPMGYCAACCPAGDHRPVCAVDGPTCNSPSTVDPDLPCDAFGPVCLPAAMECDCDGCICR